MRSLFVPPWHSIPVANYTDKNNSSSNALKISNGLIKSENATKSLLQWFKDNGMKANYDYHGRYHLLKNNSNESFQIKIGNETVANSKCVKLQGDKMYHACLPETKCSLTNSTFYEIWWKKVSFKLFINITFLLPSASIDVSQQKT